MRLGLSSVACPEWTLAEISANARTFGFDGVELRTAQDNRHLSMHTPENFARRIARLFRRDGKPIFSLKASTRISESDGLAQACEDIAQLITLAAIMDVSFVRIALNQTLSPRTVPSADLIGTLNTLAKAAAKSGVKMAIETEEPWTSAESLRAILDRIDSQEGVGVVYNLFNCYTAESSAWSESYSLLKPFICYCKLVDGFTLPDGGTQHCLVGTGELPIRKILQQLKADRFDGFISFDWRVMHDSRLDPPEHALPHFVRTMNAIWKSMDLVSRRETQQPAGVGVSF